jgi:hypothetical protein
MERRDVLKAGAIGVAARAIGTGCATVPHADGGASTAATEPGLGSGTAFLAMLDHQLHHVGQARFVDGFVAAAHGTTRKPAVQRVVEDHDAQVRRMLRTLLITQGFRDLSVEAQLEPDVQARMVSHLDEIDATVFEVGDRLAALDAADHARVRTALRERPDLAMEIGEAIDAQAAAAGLPRARRRQLRAMMMQTAFRLKHEAPGTLINEYTQKVTRLREDGDQSALALAVSERIGHQAFWAHQKRIAQAPAAPPRPTTATAAPGTPAPGTAARPAQPREHKHTVAKVGGAMMGIGVVVGGVSALILSAGGPFGFVVGITVGAILFAAGLIVAIIGAIIAAVRD